MSMGVRARRMVFALVAALAAMCAPAARAQTAENIIDRHIKAVGGAKALKAISSARITGAVRSGASAGIFTWQTKTPSSFFIEMRWPDRHSTEAFNGKSGWVEDAAGGLRTLTGREQARARAAAFYRNDHFLTYKKEKTRVNLLGRDTVAGRPAFAVEMTTRNGVQRKLFFDAQTYLLVKDEQERGAAGEEIFFSDYRAVDGVQEPFAMRIRRGSDEWNVEVHQVMHNVSLDSAVFDFPRSPAPLPDIATLLDAVEKNQKKLEAARENYTYTMREKQLEMDDKGRVKEKSDNVYEVFYAGNWTIQKLVAKNGRPLNEVEAQKEQKRVEKIIRDYEEYKKKEAAKQAKAEAEKAKGKKTEEDEDDVSVSDFLRICKLGNPRRERYRGQEVVVFEFEPRPDYKPRNRSESLIQKLIGIIWVDDTAKEIVRLEARMNDTFKMGGGLVASLQRGSSFVFEQEYVKNEVWLPSYTEVDVSARVFLVAGMKIHQVQQFSDYKKFNVDTSSEIKPPAAKPEQ